MFGFALLAACRPAHDDGLNEWSSIPPVSVTMQAFRRPPAVSVVPLLGDELPSEAFELRRAWSTRR